MSNTEPLSETKLPPRKRGRPRKADIEAKKSRNAVGRPPGEAARIKEFYARLLSTSGEKVIETVLRKAMDDADKRIVVSDIVKGILSSSNRDALQNSLHLDNQIDK